MWFFYFVKITALPFLWLILRPRVRGNRRDGRGQNRQGRLVVCNHLSMWDPMLLELLHPLRKIYFLTSPHLFDCPKPFRRFMRYMGAIPLEPDTIGQLRELSELLEKGAYVCFFPEGHISRDGSTAVFRPGFAITALAAGVPVTPVRIGYTKTHRAHVSYGSPIELSAMSGPHPSPEELDIITETVRDALIHT